MPREKMPDLKRKGNWKNAPDDTPKKKATKSRGVATTEAVKKMKRKEASVPKPKAKPAKKTTTRKAPDKDTTPKRGSVRSDARTSQSTSVKKANDAKKSKSQSDRKPLKTGARSQNTSGTGYNEGSIMDTLTRMRRGTYKAPKSAPSGKKKPTNRRGDPGGRKK